MGFFGCHHKTIALGLPLIKAIYGENPKIGLYILPLLMWHPMQLIFGSALAPKLAVWSKAQDAKEAAAAEENQLENKPELKDIENKENK